MSKKILTGLLLSSAIMLQADMLGVEVGGSIWNASPSGTISKGANSNVDVEKDLGLEKQNINYFYGSFEHPLPIIPNFKIAQTNLILDGTKSSDFSFNGAAFSNTVTSDIEISQTDLIAYYELSEGILIPTIHLDVGFGIRNLEADIKLNSSISNESASASAPVPMLYGKLKWDIPFVNASVEAETMQISVGNNELKDTKVGFLYNFDLSAGFDMGLSAGYRIENLKIDESGLKADTEFSGVYTGIYINW